MKKSCSALMKRTLHVFAMLIVTGTMVFANADNPVTSVGMAVIRNGSTFKLFYKGNKRTDVKVTIRNERDQLILTDVIRDIDGFVRPYNFSNLPEGVYTIELVNDSGREVQKVNYHSGKIEKLANLIHIAGAKDKYLLTISNKGKDVLTVKIYDELQALVYSSTEAIDGDFARVYNLEQLKGKFLLEISDKNGITKTLSF